ncbi:hypothetical protein BH23CHL2_BH23CHL2_06790 [soil metagenome]
MLDQLYTIELLNPDTGLRQRAGSRKHALRIRRAGQQ